MGLYITPYHGTKDPKGFIFTPPSSTENITGFMIILLIHVLLLLKFLRKAKKSLNFRVHFQDLVLTRQKMS